MLEPGLGLVELALGQQCAGQIVVGLDIIRPQGQGALELCDGLGESVLHGQQVAQVVPSLGIIRPQSQCPPHVDGRFVELVLLPEHASQVVMGLGEAGIANDGLLEPCDGLLVFFLDRQDVPQVVVGRGIVWHRAMAFSS